MKVEIRKLKLSSRKGLFSAIGFYFQLTSLLIPLLSIFMFGLAIQTILLSVLAVIWVNVGISFKTKKMLGIRLSKKALTKVGIYTLILSFLIFYQVYFFGSTRIVLASSCPATRYCPAQTGCVSGFCSSTKVSGSTCYYDFDASCCYAGYTSPDTCGAQTYGGDPAADYCGYAGKVACKCTGCTGYCPSGTTCYYNDACTASGETYSSCAISAASCPTVCSVTATGSCAASGCQSGTTTNCAQNTYCTGGSCVSGDCASPVVQGCADICSRTVRYFKCDGSGNCVGSDTTSSCGSDKTCQGSGASAACTFTPPYCQAPAVTSCSANKCSGTLTYWYCNSSCTASPSTGNCASGTYCILGSATTYCTGSGSCGYSSYNRCTSDRYKVRDILNCDGAGNCAQDVGDDSSDCGATSYSCANDYTRRYTYTCSGGTCGTYTSDTNCGSTSYSCPTVCTRRYTYTCSGSSCGTYTSDTNCGANTACSAGTCSSGSCGSTACPANYCSGTCPSCTYYTYPASCSKYCDGSGNCASCTCSATPTSCTGSGCCDITCSAGSGCGTSNNNNKCTSPPATTCLGDGRTRRVYNSPGTCSGCGANGASGSCSYSSYTDTDCGTNACVGTCGTGLDSCTYHTKGCSGAACYDNSYGADSSSSYCSGCSETWFTGVTAGQNGPCCGDDGTSSTSNDIFENATDSACVAGTEVTHDNKDSSGRYANYNGSLYFCGNTSSPTSGYDFVLDLAPNDKIGSWQCGYDGQWWSYGGGVVGIRGKRVKPI